MKVALDLEDVLVNSNEAFMEQLNQFIQENHPEAELIQRPEVAEWRYPEVRKKLSELRGWQEDHEKKFFFGDSNGWKGYHPITEDLWKNSPERYEVIAEDLRDKVKELSKVLKENNGELVLVTARENVREGIEKRIKQIGIREYLDDLVIETDKHELDFDIYIDDYPFLHRKLENSIQLMVDQPWNRSENLGDPHKRVKNLSEAVEVIKDLG